jgi:hypothetical protein
MFYGSGSVGLPPVPWTEKHTEVIAAETWLDGQLPEVFVIGLQKLEERTNQSIELRE